MYVPNVPLWVWTLFAGEDGQFFSQPTVVWDGGHARAITGAGACVARCQLHTWLTACDDSHRTHIIQCGQVAMLAPDGTYLCAFHLRECWTCRQCGTLLQRETDDWCSAGCQAADVVQPEEENGWDDD